MKKIMNSANDFAIETVEGIIAAYGDKVKLLNGDPQMYLSNYPAREGKVGIVTAGGSGHLPVFLGYVGQGMLDEPSLGLAPIVVEEIFDLLQRIHERGKTILLIEQNASMALSIADRGYVLETGSIVLEGTGRELLRNPEVQKVYLGG